MYNGYKIKIMIFAGRQKTMELLMPQINSKYIDEIIIAKNTTDKNDLNYINSLEHKFDKIKYITLPKEKVGHAGWRYLWKYMQDEDTVYIKLDDDIVYLSEKFFDNLLEFRFNHPEYICCFPMVVNNSYCATLHNSLLNKEHNGKSISQKMIEHFFNGKYAIAEHELFLSDPNSKEWDIGEKEFGKEIVVKQNPSSYSKINHFAITPRPQICAICFFGKVMKLLKITKDLEKYNDEEYLCYYIFDKLKKAKHGLTSKCICSHYSFSPQKSDMDKTNILEKYKALIQK